jgi:hypothetical protein
VTRRLAVAILPLTTSNEDVAVSRTLPAWTAVPWAALVFAIAVIAGLGVIESITVAAVATIGWSVARQLLRAVPGQGGGSDVP